MSEIDEKSKDAPMQEEVKMEVGESIKKGLGKRKRVNANKRRKLGRIMNPDSNLTRDNEAQVISVQSSSRNNDLVMED